MATTEVFQDWDNPHEITSISRKTTRTTTRTRTTRRDVYEDSREEMGAAAAAAAHMCCSHVRSRIRTLTNSSSSRKSSKNKNKNTLVYYTIVELERENKKSTPLRSSVDVMFLNRTFHCVPLAVVRLDRSTAGQKSNGLSGISLKISLARERRAADVTADAAPRCCCRIIVRCRSLDLTEARKGEIYTRFERAGRHLHKLTDSPARIWIYIAEERMNQRSIEMRGQ
ncbi:unnamed protein product [Trichogramma brassicae]|uniref:Uncharacterized protein n=1 Tax=Trichogramma brassicae TaxID=86971 RepID=A0A6H5IJW1_9HYME|nr:unnamed protein product [Trichogramma brassicae]